MARTIVVTGGGTGIGRAVAHRFAAAGDGVFITGRRPEPLKETADLAGAIASITPIVCDGTDPGRLLDLCAELPRRIDVLVNNAGGNTDFDRPTPADLAALAAQWRANFDANVLTALLTTEALAERLADSGRVISIGSIAADKGAGAYGAAKAALAAWNLGVADQLGERGITANVVAPGYITDTEFFRDRMTSARRERLIGATKTGRAGAPADVAETVFFLASEGAGHITGQVVHVNGGARTTR